MKASKAQSTFLIAACLLLVSCGRETAKENVSQNPALAQSSPTNSFQSTHKAPPAEKIDFVPDVESQIDRLKRNAEKGDAEAQFKLAMKYRHGDEVPKSEEKAIELLQKAGQQGIAGAQMQLGLNYQLGEGVPKDIKMAATLYEKAADQENQTARYLLGRLYASGDGVSQDLMKAMKLFTLAEDDYEPAKVEVAALLKRSVVRSTTSEVLKGLPGVFVLVEGLNPEAEKAGLTRERIQTAVELKLRTIGIRVLTEKESKESASSPKLYINLSTIKESPESGTISGSARVTVEVDARSENGDHALIISATIWENNGVFVYGEKIFANRTIEFMGQLVDKFANDFLKANPKN